MKYVAAAVILVLLFLSVPACIINNTGSPPDTTANVTTPAATVTPTPTSTSTRISPNERVPRITVEELHQKMQNNADILIIDARAGVEDLFAESHIKGAIPVPLYRFTDGWTPSVPLDKEIVLYCSWAEEATSARAALELMDRGFMDIKVLKGGYNAWLDAGYLIEEGAYSGPDLFK